MKKKKKRNLWYKDSFSKTLKSSLQDKILREMIIVLLICKTVKIFHQCRVNASCPVVSPRFQRTYERVKQKLNVFYEIREFL